MLFNDKTSLILAAINTLLFIGFCLMDVTGVFEAMDNLAIRIIILGIYALLLFNLVTANYINNQKKNLPESEEEPTDYRQM